MEITELIGALPPMWQSVAYAVIIGLLLWTKFHSKKAADAVTPNGGSSVADAVRRTEARVETIEDRFNGLEALVEQHIFADVPCTHSDAPASQLCRRITSNRGEPGFIYGEPIDA